MSCVARLRNTKSGDGGLLHLLFICSRNRLRSPTAERVFQSHPGVEAASAGLNHDAENPVTPELVRWSDLIFVMERSHRKRLSSRFQADLKDKKVVCLEIQDRYDFMDRELVRLLGAKVLPYLPCEKGGRGDG